MNKSSLIIIFSLVGIIVIGLFLSTPQKSSEMSVPVNNVQVENGVQIITIKAGGGYFPEKSTAQAGIHTIVRFTTSGSFDCSSSIRIPSLNMSKVLNQRGTTDVDLGEPKAGVLGGMCGMGMYPFSIDFQ